MNIYQTIYRVNDLAEQQIYTMRKVKASDCCLKSLLVVDYDIFIADDCVIVTKDFSNIFEIENKFQTVNKPDRMELGDYVLYLGESSLVMNFINNLKV